MIDEKNRNKITGRNPIQKYYLTRIGYDYMTIFEQGIIIVDIVIQTLHFNTNIFQNCLWVYVIFHIYGYIDQSIVLVLPLSLLLRCLSRFYSYLDNNYTFSFPSLNKIIFVCWNANANYSPSFGALPFTQINLSRNVWVLQIQTLHNKRNNKD